MATLSTPNTENNNGESGGPSPVSGFAEGNVGLLTAVSLFAALTVLPNQLQQDIIFRTYLSFWFFTAALVLAAEMLRRAWVVVRAARGFWWSLAVTILWSSLVASLLGLGVFWGFTYRSFLIEPVRSPRLWVGVPGVMILIIGLVLLAALFNHWQAGRTVALLERVMDFRVWVGSMGACTHENHTRAM